VLTTQQMFFPVLAERIADLTIPEPPLTGIADDRPAVAANLRGLFDALAVGGDDQRFAAEGSNPGEPLRSGFGKALIQAVGPLESVTLVRIEDDGTRVYRLAFQRKQWDWFVKVDSTGRIADMRPAT
jgi:hypothetical protein